MESFQAKIVWKRQRKRENTNYRFVSFRSHPRCNRKFQKKSKKIQEIKKRCYDFFSNQNKLEKAKKKS